MEKEYPHTNPKDIEIGKKYLISYFPNGEGTEEYEILDIEKVEHIHYKIKISNRIRWFDDVSIKHGHFIGEVK